MSEKPFTLNDMIGGWFIGDFDPTVVKTDAFEVGVKHYVAGDKDAAHYHKIAREITLVVSGTVRMIDQVWEAGSIIDIEPGKVNQFEALTDATVTVVKIPSAKNDKYLV
ncbi:MULTISPECIES: cupin domain-containing protein [unclassified Rhizobium]|jgi:quercetin dioxygenase-like cupin family protein|uniref:cupin domain-containing protein n=1 Tax=unclassified Rhizobium TaxID=2613769 RepID=UPI000DD93BC1|nr:cupin domain-containing protein [Rhizobium sp. UBA1881]